MPTLFPTLADQYPEPTDADRAAAAARALISLVPVAGGAINEALSAITMPLLSKRRDDWCRMMADTVEAIGRKNEELTPEKLATSEAFVSATIQASRIAMSTHRTEKLGYLRNALLKVAESSGAHEDLHETYLRMVDELTPTHVAVLRIIFRGNFAAAMEGTNPPTIHDQKNMTYRQIFESEIPTLQTNPFMFEVVMQDLVARGLSNQLKLNAIFPKPLTATVMGQEFLMFVLGVQVDQPFYF